MSIIDRDLVVEKWLEDDFGPGSDETNRISNAGHPCDRYLYLRRTEGEKALPPGQHLSAVFKRGRVGQKAIAREQIVGAGYELFMQEQRFTVTEDGATVWRGHIDGAIRDPRKGLTAPIHVWEAKIINTHTWNAINSLEDMLASSKPWIRGYPAQVMLYMYAKGAAETGVLHLVDSETWLPKFIEVPIDYQYVQELIDRGKRINAAVAEAKIPGAIDWSDTCERCPLLNICVPDAMAKATNLRMIESPAFRVTLEAWLAAKEEKKRAEEQFRDFDKIVRHTCLNQGEIIVGDYFITTKARDVKSYSVPARTDYILEVKPIAGAAEGAA